MENKYFEYVVSNKNLLIFGEEPLDKFDELFKKFNEYTYQELTSYSLENLSSMINDFKIDLIIISTEQNKDELCSLLSHIKQKQKLRVFSYIDMEKFNLNANMLNLSDTSFTSDISTQDLRCKFSAILDDTTAVANQESNKNNISKKDSKRARYRDAFDMEVMFVCEELRAIAKAMDGGDISASLFDRMEKNISKVTHIVNNHLMASQSIRELLIQFDTYLQKFDLNDINISGLEGFEQLSRFIEDIASFLDKFFITRDIGDIYIVEDSLENSFEYVKLVFEGKKNSADDGSEVEFL